MDVQKEAANLRRVGLTKTDQFQAMENLQEVQRFSSLKPLNLNYYGSERCEKGYSFGPFIRTSYVMHLVLSGQGSLEKGGKVFSIHSGDAFLIYPGEETTYTADEKDPWTYAWVGFHGIETEEMMSRAGFSEDNPVIACSNMGQLTQVMDRLLQYRELTYDNDLIRTGCLYALIGLLAQNKGDKKTVHEDNWNNYYVSMAINLLINSADSQVRVQDVARTIGLSRGYLTSIFKQEVKMSPQEFLTRFRMEKAADLLTSTDNPVGLIAAEVGYHDVLSFSKSFRKFHGVSPSRYRERKVELVLNKQKGDFTSDNPL